MITKVALISGGTRGIGRATVLQMIKDGYYTVTFSRSPQKRKALQSYLSQHYASNRFGVLTGDVTKEADVKRIVRHTIKKRKKIDALVNNAGFGYFAEVDRADMKKVQDMIATNVTGMMLLTKAVVPYMKKRKKGLIINIASIAGKRALANAEFYSATKFAVYGFTYGLRKELASYGIKVATIAPGMIKTDFFDKRELIRRKKVWKGKIPPIMDVSDITRLIKLIYQQSAASSIQDIVIMPFKN